MSYDPPKLIGEKINGKISVVSKDTHIFSISEIIDDIKWICKYHDETPERSIIQRNMRYPYTHHVRGYYLLKVLGFFSVQDSFHITTLSSSFEFLPIGIYLKIETFVEIP